MDACPEQGRGEAERPLALALIHIILYYYILCIIYYYI